MNRLAGRADPNSVEPELVRDALGLGEEQGEELLEAQVEAGVVIWPAGGKILFALLGVGKLQ